MWQNFSTEELDQSYNATTVVVAAVVDGNHWISSENIGFCTPLGSHGWYRPRL